jgi:MoaA/NifB/PqqE/SkfB family radical SAM enzyme
MSITVYRGKGLKILADVEDDRIKLRSKSLLSPVGKHVVKLMNKYYAHERPLMVESDQIHFSGWIPPMPSKAFTRLFNNEMKAKMTGRFVPEQVSVAVTGKCPCNCVFCCAKGIRAKPELTLDEMRSIIDQSLKMGTHLFTFDGGEPLLRKDIYDIIEYVDDRAVTVMFTNGLKLTRSVARKLKKAGLRCLQVSIDSPYQEEHDKIRCVPGIFEKAIQGIRYAVEEGLITGIYYVARPENTDEKTLEDLYKLAENTGAHEICIYDIIAIGKWLTHEAETMTEKDRTRTIEFHKRMNKPGIKGPKVMSFSYFQSPEKYGCMAGKRWIHLTPAGDIIPCSYTPLTFGNIRDEPLKKIYKRIRSHQEYKDNTHCLVQDKKFRNKYIYSIPKDESLPYPICNIDGGSKG